MRLEPTPAKTAAPSPSESGDITTAPLRLLINKFHGTVLCLISLNDPSDRVYSEKSSIPTLVYNAHQHLYIMSALAHQKYTLSDESFREIKHNTVPCNCLLTSVVVQWLCLLTLKGLALPS